MRKSLIMFIMLSCCMATKAQKKIIDFSAVENWPLLGNNAQLSDDGKYVAYAEGLDYTVKSLVLQSTDDSRKAFIKGANDNDFRFTAHGGKFIYYTVGRDSIGIRELSKGSIWYVSGVKDYQYADYKNNEWLICSANEGKGLLLAN